MFFRKRRRRGLGLGGILIIAAILYFTGAGRWLWERMMQLEGGCYSMLAQLGTSAGSPVCGAVGSGLRLVDSATDDFGGTLRSAWNSTGGALFAEQIQSVVGTLRVPDSLQSLGSSTTDLQQKLKFGPDTAGSLSGSALINAIDNFHIGQELMQGTGNSVANAVPWLQQGAQYPGYGLLSQLSLGDIYRQGSGDVMANPKAAADYYAQAYRSIGMLQANGSPEAQQLLSTLPASPQQVQQQLIETIRTLRNPH